MADYMKPLVLVYQELRQVSATLPNPTLPGIVIGPCYHYLTYADDKSTIASGDYDPVAGNTISAPGAVPGMNLVSEGLKVYLDDAYVKLEEGSDGVSVVTPVDQLNVFTSASATFVTNGVAVGDTIELVKGAWSKSMKVLEVVDENTLKLTSNVGVAETGVSYKVLRKLDDQVLDASFYTVDLSTNSVTLNPAATLLVGLANLPVDSAVIYLEYKALRTDVASQPQDITSTNDIETKLGKIIPENPLAYGASIMFQNAATRIQALGVETDDDTGYLKARDVITDRNVYVIALLTQDKTTIASFKAHCEAMSVPEKNKFRICIGNHSLPEEKTLVDSSATGASVTDPVTTKIIFLDDASATFITSGVAPGDKIMVETGPLMGASPYVIDQVLNENRVKVLVADEFASAASFTYSIVRSLTRVQQAEEIAAASVSLKSKRCIMTFSDTVVISGVDQPGYYLNTALAGMIAGLPSQAGLTNKGIAGIDGLKNSNFYFLDDELDIIAAGGTCIFVQQTESSLPYIRHQLTTDMDLLETKEISVVKNNDYLSIFFRDLIKKFLGEWNVTPELLGILETTIDAGIEFQRLAKLPKIGAPLINATIESLAVSEISADRVEIYLDTEQPRPLNNIGLHMIL